MFTSKGQQVKGTVVLMSKNALDFNKDGATAIFNPNFSIKLISERVDGRNNAKVGKETSLDKNQPASSLPSLGEGQSAFNISFKLDEGFGIPGAFYIKNKQSEFFLVTLTLEGTPDHVRPIHFVCNSWVYKAQKDRIFFANKTYLPDSTPTALKKYREEELKSLRGEGKEKGKRQEHEIYDYDVYNDLGNPDKRDDLARPVLGGSSAYPYPRRGRTGRDKTKKG